MKEVRGKSCTAHMGIIAWMTGEFSSKAMDTGGTFAEIKGLPTYNSIPRENILQQQKGNQDTLR